jgi:hypothetical protein
MPSLIRMRPGTQRDIAVAVVTGLALVSGIGWWRSGAFATPPVAAPAADAGPSAAVNDPTAVPAAPIDPTKVQLVFSTVPPVKATVTWGRTRIGRITPRQPLVVIRPRDSGPLDVIVRAPGFLPVQTRAQTFADARLQVRLTRVDQKATLLGYRAPIDAGIPLGTDGGLPPTLSDMPPSLTNPSLAPPAATPAQPGVPAPGGAPAPSQQPQPQPQPQQQPQPQPPATPR